MVDWSPSGAPDTDATAIPGWRPPVSSSDTDPDTAVDLPVDRVVEPVRRYREQLRSSVEPLDTGELKRVGVIAYFGVYALIALDDQFRLARALWLALPPSVRPPPIPALHELLGIYKSFAWAFTSVTVALVVVGWLAVAQFRRTRRDSPESVQDIGGGAGTCARLVATVTRVRAGLDRPGRWMRDTVAFGETDESTGSGVSVVDPSLDVPDDPLELPRSGTTERTERGVVAAHDRVPAADVSIETRDAERLDDGDAADDADEGGEAPGLTDGGSTAPAPDAPWPDEDETTDAHDGEDDEPDAAAPWPDD